LNHISAHKGILNLNRPYCAAQNEFVEETHLDRSLWYRDAGKDPALSQVRARADEACAAPGNLGLWLDYWRSRQQPDPPFVSRLIVAVEEGRLAVEQLDAALLFCVYDSLARGLMQSDPRLGQFRGHALQAVRDRFVELDDEMIELQQQLIAYEIDQAQIPVGSNKGKARSRSDLHLIRAEIGKKTRNIPIRQLALRAGKALQAMKPCFMMGPQSVAQYLEPGALTFDLIVMDEASQMKPEDAVGAIARGRRLVVVGDPKQLPPTRFFDQLFEDEDDEEATGVEESESILEASIPLFRPLRRLRWHYRSRHESLIAFSNHYFYDDDLVVMPSSVAIGDDLGVSYRHVADGVFRSRQNMPEAIVVADAAVTHMQDRPHESLGIVAMNADQAALIEAQVEQRLKSDPAGLAFIDAHREGGEPFFVKNLENVQGDERDVIHISFTYGPNAPGQAVPQRFGPVNQSTGWRRLNVLFTRAKKQVIAFSSMRPEDIRVGPESKLGVRALRDYLAYADTGHLEQPELTGRPPDSDFEIAVASALQRRGYSCAAQIGVAGFFIDIGVYDPATPGRFLLGVECDGATHHSAKSVRDRDRLRQQILEGLGWQIHRIWSTDWFKDPDSELLRLEERIETIRAERALKEQARADEAVVSEVQQPSEPSDAVEVLSGDLFADSVEIAAGQRPAGIRRILSPDEARDMLINLRENTIKVEMPDSDPSSGLLRDRLLRALLRALLRHRPTDLKEFLQRIPLQLRENTDGEQLRRYGERVFDLLSEIEA